jgi:riboflavin biosynthesis pyrimidine reductase
LTPTGRGVDLDTVLQKLGDQGVLQLMVEGGAVLQGSVLKKGDAFKILAGH